MTFMRLKKNKENVEVNLYHSDRRNSKSYYNNLIDKDPNKLSLIFLDLYFEGFPIFEAIDKLKKKIDQKDWWGT